MGLGGCWVDVRELHTGLVQQISVALLASTAQADVIKHVDESRTGSLSRPSCIKDGLAAVCFCESDRSPLFLNFEASIPLVPAYLSSALLTDPVILKFWRVYEDTRLSIPGLEISKGSSLPNSLQSLS